MKKSIIFLIILSVFIIFSLSGCYDAKGIEDFYYIVALGIDKSEDNLIKLSIQTAHSDVQTTDSSSQSSNYRIYTVDCNSIDTGINILNNYLNKTINLSHCSAIVFSKEIAQEGVKKYINILENNTQIRPSCKVIVSEKNAYDILNNVSRSGESFSSRLYDYILTSVDFTGYTIDSTFVNFVSSIDNSTSQAMAIYATVDNSVVQNLGAGIFKDDIYVGNISPLQSIIHLILTNNLSSCSISIKSPFIEDNMIDINLRQLSNTKIDVKIVNNTPYITIYLNLECIIDSLEQTFDYTDFKNVRILENEIKNFLSRETKNYLYLITKDYNSDVVGFSEILPKKFLTKDEFDKIHWNEIFQDSFYSINIETTITSSNLFNKE